MLTSTLYAFRTESGTSTFLNFFSHTFSCWINYSYENDALNAVGGCFFVHFFYIFLVCFTLSRTQSTQRIQQESIRVSSSRLCIICLFPSASCLFSLSFFPVLFHITAVIMLLHPHHAHSFYILFLYTCIIFFVLTIKTSTIQLWCELEISSVELFLLLCLFSFFFSWNFNSVSVFYYLLYATSATDSTLLR